LTCTENAALPHGGSSSRKLTTSDFILIDAGGSLHGYVADITRTFALPKSQISKEHLKIWDLVHEAQAAAYASVTQGVRAAEIDEAARKVMAREGLADKFTHRLGHGIGLEGHEEPYLNGGNNETEVMPVSLVPSEQHKERGMRKLTTFARRLPQLQGNSFSNEPGCYIEGEVGVRLEDCWYMNEDGRAVAFTPQAVSPWEL
jgi:Xaa-Pro aminopeptidase